MSYTDRINPTNKGLTTYLDELLSKNYQIPTFQRDVVWDKGNVKKLWDSIYKFYPLGSILIWKTDLKLHNHRSVGGHVITDSNFSRTEYNYILDGQQRTTSLLTSLYGGAIEGKDSFNPTLYVDLTIPFENDTDDESYHDRFLFSDDFGLNGRQNRFDEGLIVKLIDIKNNFPNVERALVHHPGKQYMDWDHPVRTELRRIKDILDNYRVSFIEVKGIQVSEVCQIFERVNQAGKPLNIFDIIVAKTYRPANDGQPGFYLRELIDEFKKTNNSPFLQISELDYLHAIAVLVNRNVEGSGVRNITDRYLNEIKTEHIQQIWNDGQKALLKTFDFFENHLHLKTPHLVPFRYFYFTITAYFFRNGKPDYAFLKQYFWFYTFHNDELLGNTTHLFRHIEFLLTQKNGGAAIFERFLIDKKVLRSASYSSRGRMSRALLSLYASTKPKDWEHCDRDVLAQNLFFTADKPNLHHIFPTNSDYVLINRHLNKVDDNTLLNIAYITQITNLDITNRPPLEYMKQYDHPAFEAIMAAHFLPEQLLTWAREDNMPGNALDIFVEARMDLILDNLRQKLLGIIVDVVDTAAN